MNDGVGGRWKNISLRPYQKEEEIVSMSISIDIEGDYLYVLVTGFYDLELALDLLEKVLIESLRHNLPRILIDYRQLQRISPSMTETYIYAASGAGLIQKYVDACGQPPRIAYLGPETILYGAYGEDVAHEYGFDEAKRTTTIDEALEWLGVGSTRESK